MCKKLGHQKRFQKPSYTSSILHCEKNKKNFFNFFLAIVLSAGMMLFWLIAKFWTKKRPKGDAKVVLRPSCDLSDLLPLHFWLVNEFGSKSQSFVDCILSNRNQVNLFVMIGLCIESWLYSELHLVRRRYTSFPCMVKMMLRSVLDLSALLPNSNPTGITKWRDGWTVMYVKLQTNSKAAWWQPLNHL